MDPESVEQFVEEQVEASHDNVIISSTFNCKVQFVMNNDNSIWFKAIDVATVLGYINTRDAVLKHVDDNDKIAFEELDRRRETRLRTEPDRKAIFINESGLYSLILASKKPEAKAFKKWVTGEVIPAIRKTGAYAITPEQHETTAIKPKHNQFNMLAEYDLHIRVVQFIRDYLPHFILIPSLGEYQNNTGLRSVCYKKGYRGGQPDLIILNKHRLYNGLAIELKTPKGDGTYHDKQKTFLEELRHNNFLAIFSDKYEEVIMTLVEYNQGLMHRCGISGKFFKTKKQVEIYQRRLAANAVTAVEDDDDDDDDE